MKLTPPGRLLEIEKSRVRMPKFDTHGLPKS